MCRPTIFKIFEHLDLPLGCVGELNNIGLNQGFKPNFGLGSQAQFFLKEVRG